MKTGIRSVSGIDNIMSKDAELKSARCGIEMSVFNHLEFVGQMVKWWGMMLKTQVRAKLGTLISIGNEDQTECFKLGAIGSNL